MNNYIVKQKDIEILMQSDKVLYYKLELLNEDMKVLDCIEGNLISDSISIDASSSIRRTYTCSLFVENSTFVLDRESKIWFDKLIKPHIGILHQITQEIQWYCLGTFLYTDLNYSYSETDKTLQITCLDMMCLLDDKRKGQLPDYKRTILANTDARSVIISLLEEVGITRYFIEFNINGNSASTFSIPYDMTFESSSTVYKVISEIINLYAGTQMYFDINGTFIISRIPTSKNEITILTDDIIQPILINEQITTSLSSVYNHIKIYGKQNEPNYYTKEVTCINGVYYASVVTFKLDENTGESSEIVYDGYDNFDVFALRIPETNTENQMININNLGNKLIVDDIGNTLKEKYLDKDTDCIFRYREESDDFIYIGQYQCIGEAYLTNNTKDLNGYAVIDENSDFVIEVIGDRLKVLTGGDYDKIPTNSLCCQRARKELYDASNMKDSLSISVIAIPWLDVNMKVEFTSNITKQKAEYIITNINCDYSTYQMKLQLSRFYPDYI
jgi:hypothetical protein